MMGFGGRWAAAPRAAVRGAVAWGPRPRLPPLPHPFPLSLTCAVRGWFLLGRYAVLSDDWMFVAAGCPCVVPCCTCGEEGFGLTGPKERCGDGVLRVRIGRSLVLLPEFSGRLTRASRGLSPCCAAAPRAAAREVVSWVPRPKVPSLPLPPLLSFPFLCCSIKVFYMIYCCAVLYKVEGQVGTEGWHVVLLELHGFACYYG